MNFKKIRKEAEKAIAKRGGTGSLKEDAQELMAIGKSKGSTSQKAKAAAQAIKVPGKNSAPNTRSGHR